MSIGSVLGQKGEAPAFKTQLLIDQSGSYNALLTATAVLSNITDVAVNGYAGLYRVLDLNGTLTNSATNQAIDIVFGTPASGKSYGTWWFTVAAKSSISFTNERYGRMCWKMSEGYSSSTSALDVYWLTVVSDSDLQALTYDTLRCICYPLVANYVTGNFTWRYRVYGISINL